MTTLKERKAQGFTKPKVVYGQPGPLTLEQRAEALREPKKEQKHD